MNRVGSHPAIGSAVWVGAFLAGSVIVAGVLGLAVALVQAGLEVIVP